MKRAGAVIVVFLVFLPCWAHSYIYTVQKGDTPESILRKLCYRFEDVAGTNLERSLDNLRAGDVIELPFLRPQAIEALKTKLTDMGRIISEKTQAHDELSGRFSKLKAESARHELASKVLAREASTASRYRLGFVGGVLVALPSSVFGIYLLRQKKFYLKQKSRKKSSNVSVRLQREYRACRLARLKQSSQDLLRTKRENTS